MAVMMQAFYWDAPIKENKRGVVAHPDERTTDAEGNAEFPAPPQGYYVYAPLWRQGGGARE